MREITLVAIDLAKSVYHVHAVDARGELVERKKLSRSKLQGWLSNLLPCEVAMEACGGAHYWARVVVRCGHTPKIIAPQFVRAYVKSNKNDWTDAAAIAEAASRPGMRYVAMKDETQQVLQGLHRVRSQLIGQRTALSNQVRGLLLEFGIELVRGVAGFKRLLGVLSEHEVHLPARLMELFRERYRAWGELGERIASYERELGQLAKQDDRCRRLMTVPGIGPLTATALVAAVSDVTVFARGRDMSAWLGVVPKQHSTGGTPRLLGISKRGDKYLRMLFIHGARSVLRVAGGKPDRRHQWVHALAQRKGMNVAAVALANKTIRTAWAILRNGTEYRTPTAV